MVNLTKVEDFKWDLPSKLTKNYLLHILVPAKTVLIHN